MWNDTCGFRTCSHPMLGVHRCLLYFLSVDWTWFQYVSMSLDHEQLDSPLLAIAPASFTSNQTQNAVHRRLWPQTSLSRCFVSYLSMKNTHSRVTSCDRQAHRIVEVTSNVTLYLKTGGATQIYPQAGQANLLFRVSC